MEAAKLQLVVPIAIYASYSPTQRGWPRTFDRFVREVEAQKQP